jgi:hypothetical protein
MLSFDGENLIAGSHDTSKYPGPAPPGSKQVWWSSDSQWILVEFDSSGVATYKFREQRTSLIVQLLRWIGKRLNRSSDR